MTRPTLLLLLLALLMPACGARLKTRRIPVGDVESADVSGLVVNHNDVHEIVAAFRETPAQDAKIRTLSTVAFFTSATELYEVDYSGALFATRRLEVELHPDASLKRAKITSTSSSAADLETLAAATKSVKDAMAAAQPPPPLVPDPVAGENAELLKALFNLMLKANLAAAEAGEPLPYPDIEF